MSKKDKKIEIQLTDTKMTIKGEVYDGYRLSVGKKEIGQIAELGDGQFATVKNGNAETFYKNLEKAIESIIGNYNLNN